MSEELCPDPARKASNASSRQQQFRVMAETSPVMIWATTASGVVDFVNGAYCAFFGVTVDDVKKAGWQPLVHPDDADEYVGLFFRSLQSHQTFRCRARVRRADGEWRWIDSHAAPWFASDGTFLGMVGSSPDIHELVEAQAAAERARTEAEEAREKAEMASRMRDEAVAMISHELRTPITAVVGWASLLASGVDDDDTIQEAAAALRANSAVLQKLLNDLLDLARLAGGKLAMDLRQIDLQDVVRSSVATLSGIATEKGVTITCEAPPRPLLLSGDPERLQQVFVNLLTNGVKFTEPDGRVDLRMVEQDSAIVIRVSDNGRGMTADFLPRVFDRFAQADRGPGLGLGLAIAKEIVELHSGTISVESAGAGLGATFTVCLPTDRRG